MARMMPAVLVIENALDETNCAQIRRAMDAGVAEAAEVLDHRIELQEDVRRASHVEVDPATLQRLDATLDAHRARIEQFFRLSLPGREGISLLRYGAGGFFKPHRDHGYVDAWPDAGRRRVSLVLFLSTSRDIDPRGTFSGGALRVYADDARPPQDIHPRAGTLVAFLSTTLHEVMPVRDGIRDAVVDWCYDPG
jgi:predicted 2-oxoglutarate/Fe(II)-dependent dioxygenase YbiX